MVRWFHKASWPIPAERISAEAYQVTETYHLGSPIKIYKDTASIYLMSLVGLIATALSVSFILDSSLAFIKTTSTQVVSGSSNSGYWLGLCLGFTFLLLGLMLLLYCIWQLLHKSRTYECTEGFVELKEKGTVVIAIRWDQIVTLWSKVIVSTGYRSSMMIFHRYSVVGIDGVEHNIAYAPLRKRIERELVRISLPNLITKFHAGEPISFVNIVVSKYGINLGSTWFSWREISPSFLYIGENLVFFPSRNGENIFIPISEIPNVCVLEALLKYIVEQGSNLP